MSTKHDNTKMYEGDMYILTDLYSTKIHEGSKLLSDIDLAILGESPEKFESYEYLIRQEYHDVPIDIYNEARKNFLQKLLLRYPNQQIYHTEIFRKTYSKQAAENLRHTINTFSPCM